jgi:hypothetical protein
LETSSLWLFMPSALIIRFSPTVFNPAELKCEVRIHFMELLRQFTEDPILILSKLKSLDSFC